MPEFKISIPKPCSQDWNGMERLDGGGRHCSECKKTVFDFSQMTDQELLNFFNNKSSVHCGRFHNTQLDRQIVPLPKTNWFISKANTIAAAAITVLSFKTLPTLADERKTRTEHIVVSDKNQGAITLPPDKIIISGTVLGDQGKPLENAKVLLDTLAILTDQDGKFSFELAPDNRVPHNLYFSFEGLVPVVRTYHPVMQSTVFEVQLPNRDEYFGVTMGLPVRYPPHLNNPLPEFQFKHGTILNKKATDKLDVFALDLKMKSKSSYRYTGICKICCTEKNSQ